jgi:hypothetical protein
MKCQGLYLRSPCKDSWFEVDRWVIKIMNALGVAVPLALGENQWRCSYEPNSGPLIFMHRPRHCLKLQSNVLMLRSSFCDMDDLDHHGPQNSLIINRDVRARLLFI